MRQASKDVRPVVQPRQQALPMGGLKPLPMVTAEISALCNTWPGRLNTAIIPGKVFKQEKRVLLGIEPDWELDDDPFRSQAAKPGGVAQFIHADGGANTIPLPYLLNDRLYVDERMEVIERPEGEDWIRIKYLADDQVRIVFFEPGEVRPKRGLIRTKALGPKFARGDRLVVVDFKLDRLWSITEEQARLEGGPLINHRSGHYSPNAYHRFGYEAMWNEGHAPHNSFHKANWWVQVLTLKRDFDE